MMPAGKNGTPHVATGEPLGRLVRRYRRAAELTQEGLAERAGVSERVVRDIETGSRHQPRADTVQMLLDALAVPPEDQVDFLTAANRRSQSSATREPRTIGLSGPIRVLPIAPEDEPREIRLLQAIQAVHPTNLPDEPTPFIGREREIEQVANLLRDPHIRLMTLTGTGGVGKTRLALQIGAAMLPDYPDGVFFVSLAALADPLLVPSAIADALSVKETGRKELLESLQFRLRAQHLLLVLDNYEHVLNASSVVASLLDACRQLDILVTSRIPLHLTREHQYAVPPLAIPDLNHLPDRTELSRYEAVALFADRASAVQPDFQMTHATAPAVARICSRLDGLPLAIELAAARIKLFPPPALLGRLSSRLELLTGGPNDRPARQRTLRNTIDWSYGLLTSSEQALFARLAVFAGGCSVEAAEAVSLPEGDFDVLEGLASLVDESLLRQVGEDEPRFAMLETIREYARERLEATGELEGLRQRHARWYLTWAEQAATELRGPGQAKWLARLESDHDNVRAALRWSLDSGDVELGIRLAVALSWFWQIRRYLGEGRHWLTELLAAGDAVPPPLRATALLKAGELVFSQGRDREAAELFEKSLALYHELGDVRGRVEALGRLADALLNLKDHERAAALLTEHAGLGREIGDDALLAVSLRRLATQADLHGDAARARALAEESAPLFRTLGDARATAHALQILASVAYREGDLPRARALTGEVVTLLRQCNLDEEDRVWDGHRLVFAARDRGDYGHATQLLEAIEARAREVGDRRNVTFARSILGVFAREQGDYDRARALAQEILADYREAGDSRRVGFSLVVLSDVARDLGDPEEVIDLCERALVLFRENDERYSLCFALHNLGLAAWYQGDHARAVALLEESLAHARQPGRVEFSAEVLTSLGLVALDQEQYERARQMFTESLLTATTCTLGTALEGLAGVAVGQGQSERAARLFGAAEIVRCIMRNPMYPANKELYRRYLTLTQEALGEACCLAAWEEGRAMTIEQAIAYALNGTTVPDSTVCVRE